MKKIIKQIFDIAGLELKRKTYNRNDEYIGSIKRPIGNIRTFLEDVKYRGFKPDGIIDVGANRGDWTKLALSIFPNSSFIMIEPQDEMEELLNNISVEHKNISYIKAGAGSKNGELIQTIYDDLSGSTFLPKADEKLIRIGKQRLTQVLMLDTIIADYSGFNPDIIKIDVQGFELEVLKGANSIFSKTELFIIETSLYRFRDNMPVSREIIEFMNACGYEIYDITEYLRRPYDSALGQIDVAFAKASGFLRKSSKWN